MIIESILAILPPFAGIYSFIKILYRVQYPIPDGNGGFLRESNSFTTSGCLIEVIGLAAAIVIYPILTFMVENKVVSRGQLNDGIRNRNGYNEVEMV